MMGDGRIIVGEHPDVALQAKIQAQGEILESKSDRSEAYFMATVDSSNLNESYTDALALTEKYFADEGLEIAPLRVISRDSQQQAYKIAGISDSDSKEREGEYTCGRALVIENKKKYELFGDDFVLGTALHEAAHSTSGNDEKFIRIVRERERKASLDLIATDERNLWKVVLGREAENRVTGDFWEEAFADLTRVRALRTLGRVHDIESNLWPSEQEVEGVTIVIVPNGTKVNLPDTISFPAEFADVAKTVDGIDGVGRSAPNYAAYALELLDGHIPGLYEDLKAARTNPTRQRDAIQKIESLRPGLYRELRDLEYNDKDFIRGLATVLDALETQKQTVE